MYKIRKQYRQLISKNRVKTEIQKIVYTITQNRMKTILQTFLVYKINITKNRLTLYPAFIQIEMSD